jgi:hypothetical protein
MPIDYFVSKLSDNIGETPEGFIICRDVCVARTGYQTYTVRDLPQESARDLGIDLSNLDASIDLYRPPEEVFSPATMASFEGKSLTNNHPPPQEFVGPDNVERYEYGHVQNVRKGEEPLESGDWPLVADLVIKREPLLSEVKSGRQRELSCGYDYELARDGNKLLQTKIVGNHVAVVPKGRAGAEARINDAAPATDAVVETSAPVAAAEPKPESKAPPAPKVRREKPIVTNLFKHVFGLGLKAMAQDADADPEKLAEAAKAFHDPDEPKPPKAADKKADDTELEPDPEKKVEKKAEVEDKKADDAVEESDDRARLHAALDKVLDKCATRKADDKRADDVDLEELRELLSEYFEEEEQEPEHQEGEGEEGEEEPEPEPIADREEPEPEPEKVRAMDSRRKRRAADGFIERVSETERPERRASDAMRVLKALRPVIARSNDAQTRRAFNSLIAAERRTSRPSTGSYAAFGAAARQRAADVAPDPTRPLADQQKLQAAYDGRLKGAK